MANLQDKDALPLDVSQTYATLIPLLIGDRLLAHHLDVTPAMIGAYRRGIRRGTSSTGEAKRQMVRIHKKYSAMLRRILRDELDMKKASLDLTDRIMADMIETYARAHLPSFSDKLSARRDIIEMVLGFIAREGHRTKSHIEIPTYQVMEFLGLTEDADRVWTSRRTAQRALEDIGLEWTGNTGAMWRLSLARFKKECHLRGVRDPKT